MAPVNEFHDIQKDILGFSWKEIVVETVTKSKWNPFATEECGKILLDHVSGEASNGEFLAVLGASGAGKTTLLNLLSGRKSKGLKYKGEVKINGQVIKSETMARLSSLVTQFEDYLPHLTVKEHLLFYARLKIRNVKHSEVIDKIESILTKFRLEKCSFSPIGISGYTRTLSGGEFKRLVLATETISDTPVILCDEPTTGLDSTMAYDVVSTLKYLASLGKVVICTVHQPSSGIVALFDRIMLMHDARLAYFGQVPDAISFFDNLGYKMKPNTNPADFFVKCLIVVPGHEEDCQKRTKKICDTFKETEKDRNGSVSDVQQTKSLQKFLTKACHKTGMQASFWTQMRVLGERQIKMKIRINKKIYGNMSVLLFFAVTFAVLFQNQDLTTVGADNMAGLIYNIVINFGFYIFIFELMSLGFQLQLVYRELQKNLYSSVAFLSSFFLVGLFWNTLASIPIVSIMYFGGGLPYNASTFCWFFFVIFLEIFCCVSFGALYAIFLNRIRLITECLCLLLDLLLMANGFYLNMKASLPFFMVWLRDVNYFSRTLEAASVCVFSSITPLNCIDKSTTCINVGDQLLEKHGFEKANFSKDLWIVVLCGVVFHMASHAILHIRCKLYKE